MIKVFSLCSLFAVSSIVFGQRNIDLNPQRVIYEYVQMAIAVDPSSRVGCQVRVITKRDPQNTNLLGITWLRDDKGEIMRFYSVTELIEYMEVDQGYETFHISTTGETQSNFHVLFRRPTELLSSSWKRNELRN